MEWSAFWATMFSTLCLMGVVRTSSLNPIVIKGNLLYDSITKERFYIKGVAYDPIPNCLYDAGTSHAVDIDILADDYPENESVEGQEWVNWRADLTDIARMNVNAIRIYTTNPDKSHSKFMNYAESLGLYVVVPLTGSSFGRLDAQQGSPSCYTGELGRNLLYFGRSVMKEYSFYHNTLMFAAGNELYLWSQNAQSFPCLKSFVRDLHTWQTGCGASMRRVPLVYAMQDLGSPARENFGEYLTSMKETEDDVLDIFGINSYIYCKAFWPWDSNSPLYQLNEVYKNYAAPFVVTEFGCQVNGVDSRKYNDVDQMMTEMQETVSGGFVYEYSQHVKAWDARGFGLVKTMASTCEANETTWFQNAYALQSKYSMDVYQNHGNHFGDWTDQNMCSWKPPSALEHTRPDFPDWTTMGNDVSWAYSNWNDALPPTPEEDPAVACPDYSLSVGQLKENECYAYAYLREFAPGEGYCCLGGGAGNQAGCGTCNSFAARESSCFDRGNCAGCAGTWCSGHPTAAPAAPPTVHPTEPPRPSPFPSAPNPTKDPALHPAALPSADPLLPSTSTPTTVFEIRSSGDVKFIGEDDDPEALTASARVQIGILIAIVASLLIALHFKLYVLRRWRKQEGSTHSETVEDDTERGGGVGCEDTADLRKVGDVANPMHTESEELNRGGGDGNGGGGSFGGGGSSGEGFPLGQGRMHVTVLVLRQGFSVCIACEPSDSAQHLKKQLQAALGLPPTFKCKIIFAGHGKQVGGLKTLRELGVQHKTGLHLELLHTPLPTSFRNPYHIRSCAGKPTSANTPGAAEIETVGSLHVGKKRKGKEGAGSCGGGGIVEEKVTEKEEEEEEEEEEADLWGHVDTSWGDGGCGEDDDRDGSLRPSLLASVFEKIEAALYNDDNAPEKGRAICYDDASLMENGNPFTSLVAEKPFDKVSMITSGILEGEKAGSGGGAGEGVVAATAAAAAAAAAAPGSSSSSSVVGDTNKLSERSFDAFKVPFTNRNSSEIVDVFESAPGGTHPRTRWRRAYAKIRIMRMFCSTDLEEMFAIRRESRRLGLEVVRESLDVYLAHASLTRDTGDDNGRRMFEAWISECHPDNVHVLDLSATPNCSSSAPASSSPSSLPAPPFPPPPPPLPYRAFKVTATTATYVDHRFYVPGSDHLNMWNSHPLVPHAAKVKSKSNPFEVGVGDEDEDNVADDGCGGVDAGAGDETEEAFNSFKQPFSSPVSLEVTSTIKSNGGGAESDEASDQIEVSLAAPTSAAVADDSESTSDGAGYEVAFNSFKQPFSSPVSLEVSSTIESNGGGAGSEEASDPFEVSLAAPTSAAVADDSGGTSDGAGYEVAFNPFEEPSSSPVSLEVVNAVGSTADGASSEERIASSPLEQPFSSPVSLEVANTIESNGGGAGSEEASDPFEVSLVAPTPAGVADDFGSTSDGAGFGEDHPKSGRVGLMGRFRQWQKAKNSPARSTDRSVNRYRNSI